MVPFSVMPTDDVSAMDPAQVEALVERCAAAGATNVVPYYFYGCFEEHDWLRVAKPTDEAALEVLGPLRDFAVSGGEAPLRDCVEHAHARGLTCKPYIWPNLAGVWPWDRSADPWEFKREGTLSRLALERPELLSRTRDGRTWLDLRVGEPLLGYPVGYTSFAYPEARAHAVDELARCMGQCGADGVGLEFVPVLREGETGWPLGYDQPALDAFHEQFGRDARAVADDDEDWSHVRADFVSLFVKELRERLGPGVEVGVHAGGASWGQPKEAYRLMVDWPKWVAEGWVDALYPTWYLTEPSLPPSYPHVVGGEWRADAERIAAEMKAIKAEVAGSQCRLTAVIVCAPYVSGEDEVVVLEEAVGAGGVAAAAASAGADAVGVYCSVESLPRRRIVLGGVESKL